MKHLLQYIILSLLVALPFAGCRDHSPVADKLQQAETCMNEYPDSALSLLKSIGQAELQSEKHRARYALLYSQERLNEIHGREDEEQQIEAKLSVLPERRDITVNHLSFSYDGADRDYVLDDVCLTIPERKITAIVGASGSGKTTLLKLILGFYEPNKGDIRMGDTPIGLINPHLWRAKSGAVM